MEIFRKIFRKNDIYKVIKKLKSLETKYFYGL